MSRRVIEHKTVKSVNGRIWRPLDTKTEFLSFLIFLRSIRMFFLYATLLCFLVKDACLECKLSLPLTMSFSLSWQCIYIFSFFAFNGDADDFQEILCSGRILWNRSFMGGKREGEREGGKRLTASPSLMWLSSLSLSLLLQAGSWPCISIDSVYVCLSVWDLGVRAETTTAVRTNRDREGKKRGRENNLESRKRAMNLFSF